jgi:uncharacterized protein (TIRG00374 family)
MKKTKLIVTLIGILIFVYLIYNIGLDKIILTFKNFNLAYFWLSIIILLITYYLAGLNIWVLAKHFRKVSFFNCIKYNLFTIFYSTFMPGKIADFLIIHYFKQDKINFGEGGAIIFFDKSISLILKSVLGILGALLLLKKFDVLFLGIPLFTIIGIILFSITLSSKKFRGFIKKHILRKYVYLLKGFFKSIKKYLKYYKKELFYNFLITVIKIIFETSFIYVLFLSLGLKVNFIVVLLIFNLLAIINFVTLPMGIMGLGMKESLGVIIFGLAGIDRAVVLNSYILKIILVYLIDLFIFIKYSNELNLLKKSKFFKKIKKKMKF